MKTKKTVLAALLLFMAGALLEAQNFPSLDASPKAYDFARRMAGNRMNWRDLAEAALWASSVNAGPGAEEKAAAYLDRINLAVTELAAAELSEVKKERGEYVLTFLHKRFLKSYSELQTRVDEIFVSGKYNCVSSAVLYMVLGLSVGLDVGGVKTKDHAFATVTAGTEVIDVETTNQYGFDPGNRKEFQDAFGKTTGYAYVPLKNYKDRAAINGAELVSLILSNRIAMLERGNRFAEAVPLAINRTVFLTGNTASGDRGEYFEDPQKDLMDCLINLGAYLLRAGKEDDVIAWVEYAGGRFPDPQRWPELLNSAANNKLVKLIRAKKTAEARTALTALKPKLDDENFKKLDAMVLESEAGDIVNSIRNPGDAEAALAFLTHAWERLPSGGREEMRTVAILAEANRLGKARDWAGCIRWLSGAIETYGANPKLESALRDMRRNRVSELHNEFAALYNKKDYTGAKASIQRSLEEFPNEKQFLQDLDLAEKALARQ
ncbi:MAG: hypothetical protein LBB72_02855 [Spirochaetaceae bacterium]|jgi:tetratricopeptide (TPR) repeat protein|nr:hypothetical protein [Spirochaetaceae bacterium]